MAQKRTLRLTGYDAYHYTRVNFIYRRSLPTECFVVVADSTDKRYYDNQ